MYAIAELRQRGGQLTQTTGMVVNFVEEPARILVILDKVPLPSGSFRLRESDMLFIADLMYPLSAMDMFWMEVEAVRPDGSVPQGADAIEQYSNRSWRRFSWHRNGVRNSAGNPLLAHFS